MTDSTSPLSDFELDSLKEMANIGTGNASIALSALLNTKVNIDIPQTNIVSMHEVKEHIFGANDMMVGIYSNVKEGMTGNLIMLFPLSSALLLVNQLVQSEPKHKESLSEQDLATLRKVGSVLYSVYLSSIAKFLKLKIVFQPPNIVSTLGSSIIDFILVQIGQKEKCLLIKINFDVPERNLRGNFVLLFTLASLAPMLDRLKTEITGV